MDRQAARTCKHLSNPVSLLPYIPLALSFSHLSCSGCIVVHVLEDRDQPELDGEGGGLPRDHLKQLRTHVN